MAEPEFRNQLFFFFFSLIPMNQGPGLLLDTTDSYFKKLLRHQSELVSGLDNVIPPPSGQVWHGFSQVGRGGLCPAAPGALAAGCFKGGLGHSGTVRPGSE